MSAGKDRNQQPLHTAVPIDRPTGAQAQKNASAVGSERGVRHRLWINHPPAKAVRAVAPRRTPLPAVSLLTQQEAHPCNPQRSMHICGPSGV